MMQVLTYNIAGKRGRRRADYLRHVADLILHSGADVIGLQEVIHTHGDPPPEDVMAELTGMHAVYLAAHHGKHGTLGNAVLCREPIVKTISHELPHTFPERRVLLEVETCTRDGLPVTVFCTHLVHLARAGARMRLAQATAVAQRMGTCWRPHVLVGDLNASPHARELHPVRRLTVHHQHHYGLRSWPARRPWQLYDHVWPGPGWVVEEIRILEEHVSDHRPVLARLGWRGAPRYNVLPDEPYLAHASSPE